MMRIIVYTTCLKISSEAQEADRVSSQESPGQIQFLHLAAKAADQNAPRATLNVATTGYAIAMASSTITR